MLVNIELPMHTWVYLPVAYVDEDLSLLHGGLIVWGPTQVNHKVRLHTQLVCIDCGLGGSKGLEENS
jgi:hypothetical protein